VHDFATIETIQESITQKFKYIPEADFLRAVEKNLDRDTANVLANFDKTRRFPVTELRAAEGV